MKATRILHQKMVLTHRHSEDRLAVFEVVVWRVPKSSAYPEGVKYRAWLSESGITLFGFDNHAPKGPHMHVREVEVGHVFRGLDALREDIETMIRKQGFVYDE